MANRLIGIEFTVDRLKIVEVSFGRRLKVFNFAVVDSSSVEPARRTEQLQHTIQVKGFEAKDAVIATSGGNVEHRLLTLPPLSSREMHFVMQRESKKLASTGTAEMVWSYDVLKKKEELGIKKNQILLVTAERPMVEAAQHVLSKTRLKVQQVTTIPEALLNLLRQITTWKKDAAQSYVHFAGNSVHVLFVHDGVLLLSREIPCDYADLGDDEQLERISNELKRSVMYFRQNFPQARLDQVIFSGDSDLLGMFSTRSSEELGISGSILQIEDCLDMSGFRGNRDEFRFHMPALAAAFGASWRKTPGGTGINLIPGKTQTKEVSGIHPTKVAAIACTIAAGAALVTGGYYFREKGRIDADMQNLVQRASVVDPKLQRAKELDQRRTLAAERAAFLNRLGAHADLGELFRSLSFVIPETAVLENVVIESGNPLKMTIRGSVAAPAAVKANADFTRFFNDLRGLPFFKAVTMPKSPEVRFEDVPGVTPVSTQMRTTVSFQILCELP